VARYRRDSEGVAGEIGHIRDVTWIRDGLTMEFEAGSRRIALKSRSTLSRPTFSSPTPPLLLYPHFRLALAPCLVPRLWGGAMQSSGTKWTASSMIGPNFCFLTKCFSSHSPASPHLPSWCGRRPSRQYRNMPARCHQNQASGATCSPGPCGLSRRVWCALDLCSTIQALYLTAKLSSLLTQRSYATS